MYTRLWGDTGYDTSNAIAEWGYNMRYFRPGSMVIACGAQGDNEPCTEAEAIRRWMIEQGVPEDAVIVEDRSTNTRENLENARAIMAERGFGTAAVCTSNYHLRRALWLARDLGIDACGIAAPSTKNVVSLVRGRLRETCSWILYFIKR